MNTALKTKPTVFTNCLSPLINSGLQHPEEVQRRVDNGSHGDIDFEIALAECSEHEESMRRAGATVHNLGVNHDLPDGVFVQDTAYIIKSMVDDHWHAFGARMGHASRQPEVAAVLESLAAHDVVVHAFPEDIDGVIEYGDVFPPMAIDGSNVVFFGRREKDHRVDCRTDDNGARWFRDQIHALGYASVEFEFRDTLHATSIGNAVGRTPHDTPLVLVDGTRCSLTEFKSWNIDVPQLSAEISRKYAWGLNTVRLNGAVVMQKGFTPVLDLLLSYGFDHSTIIETPWTQLPRRDGSPSCRCIVQVPSI